MLNNKENPVEEITNIATYLSSLTQNNELDEAIPSKIKGILLSIQLRNKKTVCPFLSNCA